MLEQVFKDQFEPKSCAPPSSQPLLGQTCQGKNVQNQNDVPVDEGISFDSLTQHWCKEQGALARSRGVKLSEQRFGFCTKLMSVEDAHAHGLTRLNRKGFLYGAV